MTVLDLGSAASLAAGVDTPNNAAVTSADRLIVEGDAVDGEGNNSVEDHLAELYEGAAHEGDFRWHQLAGPHSTSPERTATFRLSLSDPESAAVRGLVEGTLAVGKFRVRLEHTGVTLADLIPPQEVVLPTLGFQSYGILPLPGGPWMFRLVSPGGSLGVISRVYLEFWPMGLFSSGVVFTHSAFSTTNRVYLDYRRHP